MREFGFELAVGDSVHFADQVLTVIDIHGDEITFRLDHADDTPAGEIGDASLPMPSNHSPTRPPR